MSTVPELIRAGSASEELAILISHIRDELAHGRRLDDIAVIYRFNWQGEKLREALDQAGLALRKAHPDILHTNNPTRTPVPKWSRP